MHKLLIRQPYFYLALWVIWFISLWWLSSGDLPFKETPEIPFFDKILHWGYFGIGGALLTFFTLSFKKTERLTKYAFLFLVGFGMLNGALDEWHQSWSMNRSGNDLGDFLADVVGTLSGILVAQWVWEPMKKWLSNLGRDS